MFETVGRNEGFASVVTRYEESKHLTNIEVSMTTNAKVFNKKKYVFYLRQSE